MATNLKVHSGDHYLLHYCTFGVEAANDALNVRVDTARGKDHGQQILLKRSYGIATYVTKSLQMSEDTNNPVYELTTDNLQLALTITC